MRHISAFCSPIILLLLLSHVPCAGNEVVVFPLPYFDDLLVIPVTMEDDEHLFVLDSGSSLHAFHKTFASQLGEPLSKKQSKQQDGAAFTFQMFRPPKANFGVFPLPHNAPVTCVDLSGARAALGREISGFLGVPLFAECIIQADFDQRELRLMPSSTPPESHWGEPIEVFDSKSNLPRIKASIASYGDEFCMLDTGMSGSLSLRKEVYDYLLKHREITPLRDTKVASITGVHDARKGILSEFELNGRKHRDLLVTQGHLRRLTHQHRLELPSSLSHYV